MTAMRPPEASAWMACTRPSPRFPISLLTCIRIAWKTRVAGCIRPRLTGPVTLAASAASWGRRLDRPGLDDLPRHAPGPALLSVQPHDRGQLLLRRLVDHVVCAPAGSRVEPHVQPGPPPEAEPARLRVHLHGRQPQVHQDPVSGLEAVPLCYRTHLREVPLRQPYPVRVDREAPSRHFQGLRVQVDPKQPHVGGCTQNRQRVPACTHRAVDVGAARPDRHAVQHLLHHDRRMLRVQHLLSGAGGYLDPSGACGPAP